MKAVSFLPAATAMIYEMGLAQLLYGVTFECPAYALHLPKLVRCVLEGKVYTSTEIDEIFSKSQRKLESLYYVDIELLKSIEPDVIFTQDVCEICQIDTECTAAAASQLRKQPHIVALSPNNLNDVFQCALDIGKALGKLEVAETYIDHLKGKLSDVRSCLRLSQRPIVKITILEWIAPIYNCGHWIPYQIIAAGAADSLAIPGGNSKAITWSALQESNPEVLIIAPCGYTIERSLQEIKLLQSSPGWFDLKAVQNKRTYLADFDLFTQPSIGTLIDGIFLLAALAHPSLFTIPPHLKKKFIEVEPTPS